MKRFGIFNKRKFCKLLIMFAFCSVSVLQGFALLNPPRTTEKRRTPATEASLLSFSFTRKACPTLRDAPYILIRYGISSTKVGKRRKELNSFYNRG